MAINFTFGNAFGNALSAAYQRALKERLQMQSINAANERLARELEARKNIAESNNNAAYKRTKLTVEEQAKEAKDKNAILKTYYEKMVKNAEAQNNLLKEKFEFAKGKYEDAEKLRKAMGKTLFDLMFADKVGSVEIPVEGSEENIMGKEIDKAIDKQMFSTVVGSTPARDYFNSILGSIIKPIFGVPSYSEEVPKYFTRLNVKKASEKTRTLLSDIGEKNPQLIPYIAPLLYMSQQNANEILKKTEAFQGEDGYIDSNVLPYTSIMMALMSKTPPMRYMKPKEEKEN